MPLAEAQSPLHAPDRGAEPPACPWLRRRAPCMPLADAQNLLHAPDRGAEPTACPWLRRRAPCMPLAEALSPCIPPGCIPPGMSLQACIDPQAWLHPPGGQG